MRVCALIYLYVFCGCHAHVYTIYFRVTVSRDFNTRESVNHIHIKKCLKVVLVE